MGSFKLILITILLQACLEGYAQLKYDESDDIVVFSFVHERIKKMKESNKIATLTLPSYNNDSLFWEGNINRMIKEIDHYMSPFVRAFAISIDTAFQFFDVASRMRISEGYVWLFKITSPTAHGLSVSLTHRTMGTNEYISSHTNWHDSLYGTSEFQLPRVLTHEDFRYNIDSNITEIESDFIGWYYQGNTLYLEVFSPKKSIEKSGMKVNKVNYQYPTRYNLRDAPDWIRERYPEIDFDNRCRR